MIIDPVLLTSRSSSTSLCWLFACACAVQVQPGHHHQLLGRRPHHRARQVRRAGGAEAEGVPGPAAGGRALAQRCLQRRARRVSVDYVRF